MANLKLKNPSGGSLNLVSADGASDLTVTFPATTGTAMVSGNMPAFSVYTNDSSGYFNNSTAAKVRFNVENFDTNNCYDTSNYRFTPNVAGYYNFTCKILNNFGTPGQLILYLYKNGNTLAELHQTTIAQQANGFAVSCLGYANGTSDYFEIYYYQDKGNGLGLYTGAHQTFWTGHMVRGA